MVAGDFDNNGYTDLAIGAPRDAVGGKSNAGSIHILYGGPGGVSAIGNQHFTQNSPDIEDSSEAGDQFGYTLVAGDFNGDGTDDLAVGTPFEDVGSAIDAGAVNVLYGMGPVDISATDNQLVSQDSPGSQESSEQGDQFGGRLLPVLYRNVLP